MKKYLLSLLVVWISIIWFSNAWTITCLVWEEIDECKYSLVCDENINISQSFSTEDFVVNWYDQEMWGLYVKYGRWAYFNEGWGITTEYTYKWDITFNSSVSWFEDYICEWDVSTITLSNQYVSVITNDPWDDPWDNPWWWDIGWSSSSVIWWYSALTPAIDWLRGTVYEIIPYVVYIWIWVLIAVIWFYAIRWLVNWIWWKVKSNFSSKRG